MTLELTVIGPVALAFSAPPTVTLAPTVLSFTRNMPPPIKLLLLAVGGDTVAILTPRKFTKILPVPVEGAVLKERLVPDTLYLFVS